MIALLLALALQTPPPAEHAPAEGSEPAAGHEQPAGEHAAREEHAAKGAEHEEHADPAEVLMHHVTDRPLPGIGHFDIGPIHLEPTRHWAFFVLAAVVVLVLVRLAIRSYKDGTPTGLGSAIETLVLYVRDEIAEKNIGHDGAKYVPLLLSFFFFILIAALMGLLPFSATATGNLSVTLGLALIALFAMQYAGISKYGFVHHFVGMVPPGLPKWLLPIMIPVELLAIVSRPFALMIRLFANMLAGHMVITALLLLIPLMAAISTFFGIAVIPVSLALALFIMVLELLVAFIQAYIFTLLTSIFIGMSAHPAH
jgi:F-type H+-transporting ATPase subunit a